MYVSKMSQVTRGDTYGLIMLFSLQLCAGTVL